MTRLYDSANGISTSGMPRLSRNERILLRSSEQKDLFEEKFGLYELGNETQEIFEEGSSEAGNSSAEGMSKSEEGQTFTRGHRKTMSSNSGRRMIRKGSATSPHFYLGTPSSREGRIRPNSGTESSDVGKAYPGIRIFLRPKLGSKRLQYP